MRWREFPEKRRQHVKRPERGPDQEKAPEQPSPRFPDAGEQQQGRTGAMPEEQHHHVNGHRAMLAVVVGPCPREQYQRNAHLDRGDDHQGVK